MKSKEQKYTEAVNRNISNLSHFLKYVDSRNYGESLKKYMGASIDRIKQAMGIRAKDTSWDAQIEAQIMPHITPKGGNYGR